MASIKHSLLACVAHSVTSAEEQQAMQKNVLLITDDYTELICGKNQIPFLSKSGTDYQEGDTVFINEKGQTRLLYSCHKGSQTLFLTAKCNSNCIMCPYTSSYRQMATDYPADLLHEMVRYLPEHTRHVVATGGEPTLIGTHFFTVMQAVKERFPNIVCLLLTNGRSFSIPEITAKAVHSLPKHTTAAIPIHAANADLHDRITQSEGSFRQTMHGIRNILHTDFHIEIRIVVFRENLQEMLPIAKLICELPKRVFVVHFMAAEMCGNAAVNHERVWVDYPQAFSACIPAIDLLIQNGIDVELYNFPLCSIPQAYWALYRQSISDYKIHYAEQCNECSVRPVCGGVFASSLKYAETAMIPIIGESHETQLL